MADFNNDFSQDFQVTGGPTTVPGRPIDPLLPENQTPFERDMDQLASSRVDTLPAEIIKTIVDPYKIPIDLLPWLAWAVRVTIWNDDWPEERKRWVVATEIARHRLKGTLPGITQYNSLVDCDVLSAIVPPAKPFPSYSITQADRTAYLALFPQLRIYPFFARAQKRFADFTSSAFSLPKGFLGFSYPCDVGAQERYTIRATYWDMGVETELNNTHVDTTDANGVQTTYYEIVQQQPVSSKTFPGAPKAHYFLGPPDAVQRTFRVPTDVVQNAAVHTQDLTTINPGTDFIEATPQTIFQNHNKSPASMFAGACLNGQTPPPSIAWQNIYQVWYVFDPKRVPASRKATSFMGFARFGMPVYNAELKTKINGTAGKREMWKFCTGYLRPPSKTANQIANMLLATRSSMSVRDKILVNTKTKRPARPSDLIKVGSQKVGDWVDA